MSMAMLYLYQVWVVQCHMIPAANLMPVVMLLEKEPCTKGIAVAYLFAVFHRFFHIRTAPVFWVVVAHLLSANVFTIVCKGSLKVLRPTVGF